MNPGDNSPKPLRRKVELGAEVITHDDVLEKKREEQNKKFKTNANKKKENKKEQKNENLEPKANNKQELKSNEQTIISYANIKKKIKKTKKDIE